MRKADKLPNGVRIIAVPRTTDITNEYMQEQGWLCAKCGHRHSPAVTGFVCIGCPCPRTAPTVAEFDQMRVIRFEAEIDGVTFVSETARLPKMSVQ